MGSLKVHDVVFVCFMILFFVYVYIYIYMYSISIFLYYYIIIFGMVGKPDSVNFPFFFLDAPETW